MLVFNVLAAVLVVPAALLEPVFWVVVATEILVVAGAAVLLFSRKKMGFYLICWGAAVGMIVSIVLGQNLVRSVVSAIIMPLIIWLLIKNTWYEFQ